ncbi:MAG: hypothetical protein RIT81_24510 [Deltaproteobacteria bacterium]
MTRLAHGALFAAALLVFACSGGDDGDDGDVTLPRDGGMVARDGGENTGIRDAGPPRDAGPRDCTSNPNGCAMNELVGDNCECLAQCEMGFMWNQVEQRCDPMAQGECAMDSDCGAENACLDLAMGNIAPCTGAATCRCLPTCDPWVRFQQSGCPTMFDFGQGDVPVWCTWTRGSQTLPEALCLPYDMNDNDYAEACVVTTDPMTGNRTSDSCDFNRNLTCLIDGRDGNTNAGVCSRFCDSAQSPDHCEDLGPQRCVPYGFTGIDPAIGICQNAAVMDLGTTCTSSVTCAGGICSPILGNACTQGCGGFEQCAAGDTCINFGNTTPPEQARMCVKGCTTADTAGDAECQMLHPTNVCRDIFGTGTTLCIPPCTQIGCIAAGTTCDVASGRCM